MFPVFTSPTPLTLLPLYGLSHHTPGSFHIPSSPVSWAGRDACLTHRRTGHLLLPGTVLACWLAGRAGNSYFSEMESLPETLGGLELD